MKTTSDELGGTIENPALLVPPGQGAEPVALNRSIIIAGSDDAADIRIEEKSVASYHAEITFSEGIYRIRHLDGRAPVAVNGRTVKETVLRHGDSVSIAGHAFTFEYASNEEVEERG